MREHRQTSNVDIPPSVAMLQLIAGFWVSRALYIAAKLGIADLLTAGPQESTALATATGTHAPSLRRVLRALASVGVFAEDEQGRFALTPLGSTLQTDVAGSLRAWATMHLGEEHYHAWGDIMHSVQTGEPAFDHIFGLDVWSYRAQHPAQAQLFDAAMANMIGVVNASVLANYPFARLGKVVDVGGGDGSLLVALLQAHPRMQGVLLDLPHVAVKAQQRIAETSLTERCVIVAGDAFVSVPEGGDAYLLSRVMNICDDKQSVDILTNCHRAMTAQSMLLLVERVLPSRVEHSRVVQPLVLSDLTMMVMTGGRERTEAEYRALCATAGFRLTQVIPTSSPMSILEAVRR